MSINILRKPQVLKVGIIIDSNLVFMEITEEGSLNVYVMFTAKNVQLNNFYTGEWIETWKINK